MTPITQQDLDEALGVEWAPVEAKASAVVAINAWIRKETHDSIPDGKNQDVIDAASAICGMAANGTLFKDTDREITSKSVGAKGVTSAKSYAEGSVARTAEENVALAILSKWTGGAKAVFLKKW